MNREQRHRVANILRLRLLEFLPPFRIETSVHILCFVQLLALEVLHKNTTGYKRGNQTQGTDVDTSAAQTDKRSAFSRRKSVEVTLPLILGQKKMDLGKSQPLSKIDHILTNERWGLYDVSVLPSFDTGSDHRLIRAKISLNKKNFKSDTHRPAPHKIPTFKSADLESVIEPSTWKLFEDPTEDYDHLVRGLLKCADASRLSQPTTIPRLNAHATALLGKKKAVKMDPNATHLEEVTSG
ncbi:hypothetical protein Y032_0001g36 [Ancylostoma ceylanicum]|uniref:Endonuclease/exonuclease/phosphatase domain-containing protein n=1 Tax=Ancylostoma ceylanicum TaxID=53326 RepID=A0A016W3V0_9BILA|nr:hypothetical protein Y032_0001g36 [Ancylostoma ceylanicum]